MKASVFTEWLQELVGLTEHPSHLTEMFEQLALIIHW